MKIPEILLVETFHKPGSLASVLAVIADEQLAIEHLQSLRREQGRTLWEITVEIDEQANPGFYSRIDALPNARFVGKSDRVFNRHRGGKIHMQPTLAITTQQILRDIYTLGVARVCLAIRDDPSKAALFAALVNATKRVGRKLATSVIGQVRLGAAGLGITRLLRAQGVQRLIGADLRPEAIERFRDLGGEPMALPEVLGSGRHRGRDHRREGAHQARMGASGSDRLRALESRIVQGRPGGRGAQVY